MHTVHREDKLASCLSLPPELELGNLRTAREWIFGRSNEALDDFYPDLVKENYSGFDLETWGKAHLGRDLRNLFLCVQAVGNAHCCDNTRQPTSALVVGCGPGRLVVSYYLLLRRIGYREIVFVDVVPDYVESAKKALRDGLLALGENPFDTAMRVEFVAGDFLNLTFHHGYFTSVFALWHVTPEFMTLAPEDAFRMHRAKYIEKIALLLADNGIFVEEVPDVDSPGTFYNLAKHHSAAVFAEAAPLVSRYGAVLQNLCLSYFGHLGQGAPAHVRFMPTLSELMGERGDFGLVGPTVVTREPVVWQSDPSLGELEVLRQLLSVPAETNPGAIYDGEDSFDSVLSEVKMHLTVIWRRVLQ